MQVEHLRRPRRHADRLDLPIREDNSLILFGRSTRAVNHAHVLQRDYGSVNFDELLDFGGEGLGKGRGTVREREYQKKFPPHSSETTRGIIC